MGGHSYQLSYTSQGCPFSLKLTDGRSCIIQTQISNSAGYNCKHKTYFLLFLLKTDFIYLFIFREGEEGNINVWLPLEHPLLGACAASVPDWESNQ